MVMTQEDRDAVWAAIMQRFSEQLEQIPLLKPKLRELIGLIDDGLGAAEVDILASVPADTGHQWLIDHQSVARRLIVEVAKKRQEVL